MICKLLQEVSTRGGLLLLYSIWLTVFVDLGLIVLCVLVAFTTGVTISIGLSLTCKAVTSRYAGGT